jgi:hypothetical protein
MFHDARLPRIDAAPADALVLTVYRCAMAGFSCDQAACFDIGWQALLRDMPLDHARGLFGEFHHFVRTLIAADMASGDVPGVFGRRGANAADDRGGATRRSPPPA